MKPLPTDPMAQRARLIAALCEDMLAPEYRHAPTMPRADAVIAVARHTRETK